MTTRAFARTGMALLTVAAVAAAWSANVAAQDPFTYEDMTVGFIQTGSESGWRAANTASFQETAEQLGIDLKFYDAQNKLENQVSAFHQFNQDPEVDVIILAALDVTGYDEVLQEAQDNGKIVVLEDRRIDADPELYATYIGSDFNLEGQKAAAGHVRPARRQREQEDRGDHRCRRCVGRHRPRRGLPRGHGRVRHRDHRQPDRQLGRGRVEGRHGGLPQEPRSDIAGVFGHNDEEAIGAVQAIEEAGLVPGEDIKVIGVDATAHGFDYLIPGKINALIECNPLLAPQVYEAALAAMNGEELPTWVPSQEGEFFAAQGAEELDSHPRDPQVLAS